VVGSGLDACNLEVACDKCRHLFDNGIFGLGKAQCVYHVLFGNGFQHAIVHGLVIPDFGFKPVCRSLSHAIVLLIDFIGKSNKIIRKAQKNHILFK